jgi:uncharacterized membrane protein
MSSVPPPHAPDGQGTGPWQQRPGIPTSPSDGPAPQPGQVPGGAQSFGAPQPPGTPAPGSDLGSDLGAALRWMWQAFARNVAAFLVPAIVWTVVIAALATGAAVIGLVVFFGMVDGTTGPYENPPLGPLLVMIVIVLVGVLLGAVVSLLWQTGAARAADTVRGGGRPRTGASFAGGGRLLLTALLIALMVLVGTLLAYLPGIAVSIFTFFALPAAARGAGPVEAIKESFSLVKNNFATTIVAYLILMAGSTVLGFLVVGTVLLIPLLMLFQFGLYERLNGRDPVEPVRA